MPKPFARTAADLGLLVLDHLAGGRPEELAALFAEDGSWELAYLIDGMTDDQLIVHGRRRIGRFHAVMAQTVGSVRFHAVHAHPVSDGLAFVQFRSQVVTAKGEIYGNRYVARAEAADGELTRWLEFFDPRPAALIRRDFAESAARG